ncbi:hypothetical protein COCON_G00035320 [Conger conger]|uniref:Uncharacterized protein n=1 Tax=Conger conger TaxID=82655 RepID=A0A9Q1I5S8_CONCO|nr:hypothetical protein COCON_G00035320 [Conger conger]
MKAKNRDQSLSDSRELDGSYDQLTAESSPGRAKGAARPPRVARPDREVRLAGALGADAGGLRPPPADPRLMLHVKRHKSAARVYSSSSPTEIQMTSDPMTEPSETQCRSAEGSAPLSYISSVSLSTTPLGLLAAAGLLIAAPALCISREI